MARPVRLRLVDPATESTVALLRAEELDDLHKRYAGPDGSLVLRPDEALVPLRWEARRLISTVLRDDQMLTVRVEALAALPRVTAYAAGAHRPS